MTSIPGTELRFVRLGPLVVDLSSGEVWQDSQRLHIPEQPTRLLLALLERPGEIVTREDLRTKLWPDDTNVEFNHSINAAVNKLRQALKDSSDQPQFIETIPRRGYRLVARVGLAENRTQPAEIGTEESSGSELVPHASPDKFTWWSKRAALWTGAGALLLLLVATSLLLFHRGSKGRTSGANAAVTKPTESVPGRIAVIGFKNLSNRNDKDWLSTAFSEMLSTELGTGATLHPVSGEDVAQMKRELAIADADSFAAPTLGKIRRNLGAELVVVGSFLPLGNTNGGDRLRFDIHLQNTQTGETVASVVETGSLLQLFDMIGDAGLRLRERLGAAPLSTSEQAEIRDSVPANDEALRLYSDGLEKFRQADYVGSRQVLVQAVAASPKNPLVRLALSRACASLGYDQQAAREAEAAFHLAKGLTYEEGLRVEAQYYEATHNLGRAEQIYQRLWTLSPGTIEFPLRLAYMQIRAGKAGEAIATLDRLQGLPRSAADDAKSAHLRAIAENSLGHFNRAVAAAQDAATLASQNDAPDIVVRAKLLQAAARQTLGENTEALNLLDEAERMSESLRDSYLSAMAMTNKANILAEQGDMHAAVSTEERALALEGKIGNEHLKAATLSNLALMLGNLGELAEAQVRFRDAYEGYRLVDDLRGQADVLRGEGDAWFSGGSLNRAKRLYEQSLQMAKEFGDQQGKADSLDGLGRAAFALGDLAGAQRTLEESVAVAHGIGDKARETNARIDLGEVIAERGDLKGALAMEQNAGADADTLGNKSFQAGVHLALAQTQFMLGNLTGAQSNYEQALALNQSTGARINENETRYRIAELAVEQGQFAVARDALQFLQETLKDQKTIDGEMECLILEGQVAALNGQRDQLRQVADRAQRIASNNERVELQLSLAEVQAKAAVASGEWALADRTLRSALSRATQSGCLACELKVQFSYCDLLAKKDSTRGAMCFEQLGQKAESSGFGLIAAHAAKESQAVKVAPRPITKELKAPREIATLG